MKRGPAPASVPAEPYLRRDLLDAEFAASYLSYAAASDDPSDFLYALREVAEAYGGLGSIAARTKLNRQQLYKTLSAKGNPELRTLMAILQAAGFSLAIVPKARRAKKSVPSGRRKTLARSRHAALATAF